MNGIYYGGIYKTGICKQCNKNTVIYSKTNLCMSCIIGKQKLQFCPVCNKETYHYQSGTCRSCVSKGFHKMKFCEFCQKETMHFNKMCKSHTLHLIKNNGKIELHIKTEHTDRCVISDVEHILNNTECIETPKSVLFNLPDGYTIKCKNDFVKLEAVLYNKNVSNWLKIKYKYDGRSDHIRSITLTEDHPLPLIDGTVKSAKDLVIGDKLVRTNVKATGSGKQWDYAEIISISIVEMTCKSYDVTTESSYFNINDDILSHNCRSFLTPDLIHYKTYGRFNQGVVTINLPDVALTALKNTEELKNDENYIDTVKLEFWKIFDERLELCHKALQFRHRHLRGTLSDVSPIHWQHGAVSRLQKHEPIDKLLYNGYSTISLGYAGLYECVLAITGYSHTSDEAKPFALEIMEYMNTKTKQWKDEEHIDYSVYGSPIESTTEKFARTLKKRFGIIPNIISKGYITNSYHVNVREKIDPFTKLQFESEFQRLSPGGAISYIETANLTNNVEAVLEVIKFIYDNILYAELNTKSDYCQVCGYDGEIEIVETKNGKLDWKCPNCGNTDHSKLNITRRTCGYLGSNFWNQGRTEEIKERFVHLGSGEI